LLSGYVGKSSAFDEAIEQFALAYAQQNEADWGVLKAAVKSGRVQVIHQ
jgi:ASC-1-like (ASCH) protein